MGVVLLAILEAAWRLVRAKPPGSVTERLQVFILVAVGVTIAGGLGLVAGGAGPREPLHFVYAIVALGAVPVASSLGRRASVRQRAALSLGGAVVALVVIARLFQTG